MAKILLVEDDKSLREIYGVRLSAEGYEIVSAGDGEEALAMAIKERPDLIVSDVMMPKISGFDMLDILRSTTETKNVKVIMMTALSSEDQRARGEALGADRYLVKSQVGIEDVVRTVHDVLADGIPAPAPASIIESAAPAPAPVQQPAAQPEPAAAPAFIETPPVQAAAPAPQPVAAPVAAPAPVTPAPEQTFAAPQAFESAYGQAPVAPAEPQQPQVAPQPAPQPYEAPAFAPTPRTQVETPSASPFGAPVPQAPAPLQPAQPAPAFQPEPVQAPAPVPAPVAPAPQPSVMPQPIAPFGSPAPASLGERVIAPLNDVSAQSQSAQDLSNQIEQALNGLNTPTTPTPPTV